MQFPIICGVKMSVRDSQKSIFFLAEVVSTKDPKKMGRVQVKLSSLDKAVEMPWIRVLQAQASKSGVGTVILPDKGDVVAILRGAGEHYGSMLMLGGLYDGKNKPGFAKNLEKNDYKYIQTREKNLVILSDQKNKTKIEIKTSKGIHVLMDDKKKKLTIKVEAVKLTMDGKGKAFKVESPDKVLIKGKDITIQGSGNVVIKGKTVKIQGSFGVDVKGKDVKLKASMNAKIDGLNVAIKGSAMAKLEAGAKVVVKGAMTSVG